MLLKVQPDDDLPCFIQVKLGISSAGCSPHVDFDYTKKVLYLEKCWIYESLNYIRQVKNIWCKAQSVYCKKYQLGPENYIVKLKLYLIGI